MASKAKSSVQAPESVQEISAAAEEVLAPEPEVKGVAGLAAVIGAARGKTASPSPQFQNDPEDEEDEDEDEEAET